ncbi:MAG TPA: S1C family serine protease [Pirellulaceae bacterium]|nr:S1C family serine protease [Pirellulaceae bacterium]
MAYLFDFLRVVRRQVCRAWIAVWLATLLIPGMVRAQTSLAQAVADIQPKMVKIYGAGGLRGLEEFQSGFFISADGYILTVWSYILDADVVDVTLSDGRKFEAQFVGMDPRLEIAVLKIEAAEVNYFNLDEAVALSAGARVLAINNMYGVAFGSEAMSVLSGVVSAKTDLAARSGVYETNYRGPVYVLDAMTNNPGAPGGALTDRRGRLAGILGKELKNAQTNTLLNFAIPVSELAQAVEDIRAGKQRPSVRSEDAKKPKEPHTLTALGIQLVSNPIERTPPFVEAVKAGSPAAAAGIKRDDLILFVNGRIVASCKLVSEELSWIDRLEEIRLTVQRGQELLEFAISPGN